MTSSLAEMMARHARLGRVEAIFVRPARREVVCGVQATDVTEEGLAGDHSGAGNRALTLIQAEHLAVIAALAGLEAAEAGLLRRNIVVSGLNLLGFRKARLRLGTVLIDITGPCPPCSRMEEVLGPGGYTAMRGHGGVYATVVQPGRVATGDGLCPSPAS